MDLIVKVNDSVDQSLELKLTALESFIANHQSINWNEIEINLVDSFISSILKFLKFNQLKVSLLAVSISSILFKFLDHSQIQLPIYMPFIPILVEKLGDSKDRVRDSALSSLVILFERVSKSGCTSMINKIETSILTKGFLSKTPKARESAIKFFIQSVMLHSMSLKPFIGPLVKLLEDQNGEVRSCSKDAIIDCYKITKNGALKQDILKELEKQNIRDTIVDSITKELNTVQAVAVKSTISSPTNSPEHDSQAVATGSTASEPSPIMVNSPKDLENELKLINSKFVDKETEQNWSDRELSLQRLRGLIRGNCISMKLFAENLKSLMEYIIGSIQSLRSALVLTSSTVIAEFSTILQDQLDPLADMILPVLVKLSGSSKKLISVKIIHTTKIFWSFITWQPKHFAVLNTSINDKGPMVRQAAAEMLKLSLEKIHNDATLQAFVEKSNILDILQKMFKRSLVDSEVMVRNLSRDAFYYFNTIWPDMAIQIVDSLDNSARKAIAKTPKPTRTMLQLPEINCADGIPLEINQIDMVEEMDDEDTVDSVEADEEFDEERIIVELQNKTKDSISILLDFIRSSLDKDVAKPIFSPDAYLQVKQILTDLYSDSLYTNDHMANFINLDSIKLFVEAKLLTLEGLLVPMILVNSSTDDELIKNDFEAFKYYLQSELEATDILTTLLNSIPKIGMSGFRVKKNIKTRKIEQQAKEYILSWVSSMVDTVVCEDHDVDVIMVRLIMDRVVPVLCTQGKTEASVESAKHILMAIHQLSPSDFLKKLDTFDFEMSGIIRETCHISEDLPDEDEQMQEEAQMVEEFSEQIFDEISGNDVLNESLPHDFEGVSYSCDEVSQDNDSVSGDFDMCNQIDQATPKKFNGHMKQVEFDEVNVREGPSGLVGFMEDESEITSSIKPPSLEALQHFVDHPATPKRMYEDPFQNADDFKELGKTPKQYRFSNQRDELGQLIGHLETEQNILPVISRLYALSRKFKYTLTDMTGADYWECHFETLVNFLMDQLAPQRTTMTNQEQYLMLLNQLICNQTCMLSGMETNLLLLLFSCRSDGTEEISGSADFALLSLARVYPCQVLLDQVLSLVCEHWNLDDPDNDAYAIRTSAKLLQINQAFKPTPFASSLYLIGKLAVESGNIQETVFINSIVPIIKNALEHPSISIRKAGYECLVDFAIAFEQNFWSITTHSFTTDQLRIVHCLKAQIQSHR